MKIYLDNAATTRIDPEVISLMHSVLNEDFGNPSSVHSHGRKARTVVEDARKKVAEIINASIGEIFFTSSATESNNTAIIGAVRDLGVQTIISSPTEHPCVLNTIKYVEEHYKVEILYLEVDDRGNINLSQLDSLLETNKNKILVSLMHGNNEIGTMLDLEKCASICEKHEALFHTDAVQTIGKNTIDLSKIRVNFLSATGHKIHGPKGTGMLYVNSQNFIKPLISGGGQERNMRSGTENTYGIAGFAKALDLLHQNKEGYNKKLTSLRNRMIEGLEARLDDVTFNGNDDRHYLSHVLSVSIPVNDKTDMVIFNLDINGISASAGSACSSGAVSGSHVMKAIGHPDNRKAVRFSFCPDNTFEEIDFAVDKFCDAVS